MKRYRSKDDVFFDYTPIEYRSGDMLAAFAKAQRDSGLIQRRRREKKPDRDLNIGLALAIVGLFLAIVAPLFLGVTKEIF